MCFFWHLFGPQKSVKNGYPLICIPPFFWCPRHFFTPGYFDISVRKCDASIAELFNRGWNPLSESPVVRVGMIYTPHLNKTLWFIATMSFLLIRYLHWVMGASTVTGCDVNVIHECSAWITDVMRNTCIGTKYLGLTRGPSDERGRREANVCRHKYENTRIG